VEAIKFEMDISAMRQWLAAWKQFPREAGKWTAKMVNDMAFEFRAEFPGVLKSRYTIRDPGFIAKTVKIDKARPRSHMADIAASVGTWYGTGRGGVSGRFSGFEEEITGSPSTVSRPKHRVITSAGRMGKTMAGKSHGWARMQAEQKIPSIIDLDARVPEEHRFAAFVRLMAAGKIPVSPGHTFILEGGKAGGGEYKRGLYRFKRGALPVKEAFHEGEKQVEMIQLFQDKPVMPPKWDWRGEAEEKVRAKFTPGFIFANYISKAIEAAKKQGK
jgi:hypothetical protein